MNKWGMQTIKIFLNYELFKCQQKVEYSAT